MVLVLIGIHKNSAYTRFSSTIGYWGKGLNKGISVVKFNL